MDETLGDIRVPRMIWTQTLGVTGCLLFCWFNTAPHAQLPYIVDMAKIYPNSIVFRIGMLYSLFILFLNNLFIHWWLQDANQTSRQKRRLIPQVYLALFSCVCYGLSVSCVDNARINYDWLQQSATYAAIGFGFLIDAITWNINKLRQSNPSFVISGKSWNEKKILTLTNIVLQVVLFGIGFGQIDINYKLYLEWLMIINTLLYFLTFRLDFKKCKMGVEIDEWSGEHRVEYY